METQTLDKAMALTRLNGEVVSLADYEGKTLLIVNTASQCGFTKQYEPLEDLHKTYSQEGLAILGFPCDQFGHQEPGGADEIGAFCTKNYGVTFHMFEKIEVNGPQEHPLYAWLKAQAPGLLGSKAIKWNFTKFVVSADRSEIKRYAPNVNPKSMAKDIEIFLKAKESKV